LYQCKLLGSFFLEGVENFHCTHQSTARLASSLLVHTNSHIFENFQNLFFQPFKQFEIDH